MTIVVFFITDDLPSFVTIVAWWHSALEVVIETWLVNKLIGFVMHLYFWRFTGFMPVTFQLLASSFGGDVSVRKPLVVHVDTRRHRSLGSIMSLTSPVSTVLTSWSTHSSGIVAGWENSSDFHSALSNFAVSIKPKLFVNYMTMWFLAHIRIITLTMMIWE